MKQLYRDIGLVQLVFWPTTYWSAPGGYARRASPVFFRLRRVLSFNSLIVLTALLVACGSTSAPTLVVPPACTPCRVITSSNIGTQSNELSGVAALTLDDAWAVGHYYDNNENLLQLIEHWDGVQWSIVSAPHNNPGESDLQSVAALIPTDVWAVGSSSPSSSSGSSIALIEHWNGAQWSSVSHPATVESELLGVTAIATADVWAVGDATTSRDLNQPLIEHWNGQQWSVIAGGTIGNNDGKLKAVTALAANNIWAVGSIVGPQTKYGQGLIEHWNGVQWSVSSSAPYGQQSYLTGVAAVSDSDVYAVGYYFDTSPRHNILPFLEHWNGSQWSVLTSPTLSDSYISQFNAVAVITANDIWIVGSLQSKADGITRTLLEQWNGRQWSVFSTSSHGSNSHLDAIAPIPGSSQLWGVGGTGSSPHDQTIIEHIG